MSSHAVGHGLEDLELWLKGLFTAAELAAADLLLRLSGDNAAVAASTSTTPSSSPRWVISCPVPEDLTVDDDEEERVVQATELDRRARKRYHLLSDLYAATSPVKLHAAAKKRNTCDDDDQEGAGGESE